MTNASAPRMAPAAMKTILRLALAFTLSFVLCGTAQQAVMTASGETATASALAPLAAGLALITLVFGIVAWRRPARAGRNAAILLAAMLVCGIAIYSAGANSISPGVGGNIGYLVAQLIDFYFLAPAMIAVPVHGLLLRPRAETPPP